VHAALESRDNIPRVVVVLGADDNGVNLLEHRVGVIEEAHAELLGGFSAATCIFVRYADEICGGEIP
jgi:hypothetical protein